MCPIPPSYPLAQPRVSKATYVAELNTQEALWARAIESPSSLTAEERRTLLRRPSISTEEANLSHIAPGLDADQLLLKATEEPESLSIDQCMLIENDFHWLSKDNDWDRGMAVSALGEKARLFREAQSAVQTTIERSGSRNASDRFQVLVMELVEWRKVEAEKHRIKLQSPPPWIQQLQGQTWGFAVFRSRECVKMFKDEVKWERYQRRVQSEVRHWYCVGSVEALNKHQLQWEDSLASDVEGMAYRKAYCRLLEEGHLRPGILRNVVLVVTTESVASTDKRLEAASRAERVWDWVWAYDPTWTLSEPDEDGYEGKLKVVWENVLSVFYMVMSEDRLKLKDLWRKAKASNEDGIWSVPWNWSKHRNLADFKLALVEPVPEPVPEPVLEPVLES